MDVIDKICDAINKQKRIAIDKYDSKIKSISNETNIASIYYLLAETFGNTMEQGELGIAFLKEHLLNDFFTNANTLNAVNDIIFYNDDFEVAFSKSLDRCIVIKFKGCKVPSYYREIDNSIVILADLLEKYLNNKTFKNFKSLADHNCRRYRKSIISSIRKYIHTYKGCNKEKLYEIREKQKYNEIAKLKYEEEKTRFQARQAYAKEFINNLTDLQIFKDSGWRILYKRIENDGKISW